MVVKAEELLSAVHIGCIKNLTETKSKEKTVHLLVQNHCSETVCHLKI